MNIELENDIASRIREAMLEYETDSGEVIHTFLSRGRSVLTLKYEDGSEYQVQVTKIK